MSMLPTETVLFKIYTKTVPDSFGDTKLEFVEEVEVGKCLVQPGAVSDLSEGFNLQESQLVTIHIPKTYKTPLQNCEAVIRGVTYNIVAAPIGVTSSPLQWDRHVVCEVAK